MKSRKRSRYHKNDKEHRSNKKHKLDGPDPFVNVKPDAPLLPVFHKLLCFNQGALLKKLDAYLQLKNKSLKKLLAFFDVETSNDPKTGCCYGLTMIWLRKMKDKRVNWYYQTVKEIILTPLERFDEILVDVEKFLALMKWAQYSKVIEKGIFIKQLLDANDFNMEFYSMGIHDFLQQLNQYLVDGNMICVSTNENRVNHAVGIYVENGIVWFFDSNHDSGLAVVVRDSNELAEWLAYSLYSGFGDPIPDFMELKMEVASGPAYQPTVCSSVMFPPKAKTQEQLYEEFAQELNENRMHVESTL